MEPQESFWSTNPLQSSKLGTDGDSHPSNSAEANGWVSVIFPSASTVYYSKILSRSRVVGVNAWNFLLPSINTFPNIPAKHH